MAMETREFDGKTFYALKGFKGYYATTDGTVLSTHWGVRLLKISIQGTYHPCRDGKVWHITKAHVAYMVQNDCAVEDIPCKYVYIKDGKAYASDRQDCVCRPKVPGETALKRVEFMENEMAILRRFYATQRVKELRDYIKSKADLLTDYAMRTLCKGVAKAKELVQDAISEFYIALYKGLVTFSIFAYVKKIMRNLAAKECNYMKHYKEVSGYTFDKLSARI